MINKQDIDKIIETARVEEVVADFVTLKKRGVNLIGLCPFHDEKTPSFYVSPAKGIYKCFGCGKGGNSVNFLMDKGQMTYPEALRTLAKKYNIEIVEEEQTPELIQQQNDRESLFVASSFAQKYFTENLYSSDEGKSIGLGYFKERGFRDDIIQKFQLGYSLNKRTAFTETATKNGHRIEYLVKAGLTIEYKKEESLATLSNDKDDATMRPAEKNTDSYFDRFFARVMFPIHNVSGRVIAFGGRTLRTDTKKIAKYINSPETEIYHKSDVLYGIYFAKNEINKTDNCYLVEGYTDVISMHQAGVENVVASSGTSLTVGQIRLIRRFTNNITILYDGDSAGIKASFRGIDLILEEGLNVKVLLFPDGEDPDSFSKKTSNSDFKEYIVNNATDFISFKTNLLMGEVKNDPLKKATLIKDIVQSIALIPEAIFRSVYVKECSRIMNMEEQVLLNELNKIRTKNFHDKKTSQNAAQIQLDSKGNNEEEEALQELEPTKVIDTASTEFQERDIIRLLINFGNQELELKNDANEYETKKVVEFIIQELEKETVAFKNPMYHTIYTEFHAKWQEQIALDYNHFVNHENLEISSLAVDMVSSQYILSDWAKHNIEVTLESHILKKSIYNSLYSLFSRRVEIQIVEIQGKLKENLSDDETMDLMVAQHKLLEIKKDINQRLGRIVVK